MPTPEELMPPEEEMSFSELRNWLANLGIKGMSDNDMQELVRFARSENRSREEMLHIWLAFEPNDADLEKLTLKEVWAIWHIRSLLRMQMGEQDCFTERWQVIHNAERYQKSYESGEKSALMEMLAECARTGMRIPKWAANALCAEVQSVKDHEKGTWDEVFGQPVPKGAHLSAMARRKRAYYKMLSKFRRITCEISEEKGFDEAYKIGWGKIPGVAIDDAFFDDLGVELGVSKTVAKELYYEHKQYTHQVNEDFKRYFAKFAASETEFREKDETSGNTED